VRAALAFTRGQRRRIAATVALTTTVAALTACEPLVIGRIFDVLSRHGMSRALAIGVAVLIGIVVARELLGATGNWLGARVRLALQRALLDATVGRLHALPVSYHRGAPVGVTMTRLERGVNGLGAAFAELGFNIFPAVVYLAVAILMMVRLHAGLTLAVVAVLPVPALLGVWAAGTQTRRDATLLDRWGKIYARFNQVLSGIATVKSFAMEQEEKQRFMRDVDAANALVVKGVAFDARVSAAQNLATGAARAMVLAIGGTLALTGRLSVGALLAFLGYLGGLFGPVQGLTGIYQTLRRAAVSLDAVFSILEAEDQVPDAQDAHDVRALKGEVVFDSVSFGYGQPVLSEIGLRAAPGEIVALVGPSGGGKTMLMSLLQRLHDPDRGTIKIDGVDIRTVAQRSLRRQIGVVMQDALLFDDTVGANIAYGRPGAIPAEIEAAARAANAHDFIAGLPRGYESFVGERGNRLSAGQRQRIAIARALLKNPPILVLDEATSALDAEAEAAVQEAVERLMAGRTTFVIAHRLATIVRADQILVLRGGRIAARGTHAELMCAHGGDGYYAKLVRLQTRGLIVPSAA
jgi:ATP-binding cassette subfamily B protein